MNYKNREEWKVLDKILFIGIILIFCSYRLDSLRFIFSFPEIRLTGPDSYYHLRRIIYSFENYPKILMFDNFLSYPDGDYVPWPFLYDFLVATFGKILGNPVIPAVFSSFLFSVLFLTTFIIYQRSKGKIALFTSLSIISVAHLLAKNQWAGYIDHHSLEVLIVTSFYLMLMSEINNRIKFVVLSILVSISFLNWPGAPIYYFPVFLYIFHRIFFIKKYTNETIWLGFFLSVDRFIFNLVFINFKSKCFSIFFQISIKFSKRFLFFDGITFNKFLFILNQKIKDIYRNISDFNISPNL